MTRRSVQLAGVSKQFGSTRVIHDVNLRIEPGELVVFVGPSGCGKSTLLRLIAGLEEPSRGSIHISGRDVTHTHPSKRGVAMVFQSYALYPHMTVAENMGFGLKIQGTPREEIATRVRRAAEILQLEALLDRKPRALSGGQRQRVAIGRAIVREPDVFLFDEPLSNLDAALRGQMRVEIARLHARLGATMIYVTHDQVEAMTLASRIVVLNGGRIEQVGSPLELYHRPANLFVAGFLGSPRMNFLAARVVRAERGFLELDVAGGSMRVTRGHAQPAASGLSVGDLVTVGIRPERLSLQAMAPHPATPAPNDTDPQDVLALRGEVTLLERLGSEALAHIRSHGERGETLVAKLPGDLHLEPGAQVTLTTAASSCHVFDATGNAVDTQTPVNGPFVADSSSAPLNEASR
ncbi:MAG TPA: ABC transporter ATP-binding protein [Steroidobacteraceae bacterium]|nr:ABC transporter ATP-binding protein [Steroidobacteraceae bacterium]